jgi:hypothetical protein
MVRGFERDARKQWEPFDKAFGFLELTIHTWQSRDATRPTAIVTLK